MTAAAELLTTKNNRTFSLTRIPNFREKFRLHKYILPSTFHFVSLQSLPRQLVLERIHQISDALTVNVNSTDTILEHFRNYRQIFRLFQVLSRIIFRMHERWEFWHWVGEWYRPLPLSHILRKWINFCANSSVAFVQSF